MIEARDKMGFVSVHDTIKEEHVNSRTQIHVSPFVVFPEPRKVPGHWYSTLCL